MIGRLGFGLTRNPLRLGTADRRRTRGRRRLRLRIAMMAALVTGFAVPRLAFAARLAAAARALA